MVVGPGGHSYAFPSERQENQSSMPLGQKIMDQGSSTKYEWRMWGQRKISCVLQSSQIILGWERERLRAQVEWSQAWLDRQETVLIYLPVVLFLEGSLMFPFYSIKEKENITFDLILLHRWFILFKWPVLGPCPLKCLLYSVTTGRRLALSLHWQQDIHEVQEVILPITWILNSGQVSFLKLFITSFVQSFAFSTWTERALLCSASRDTLNIGLRRNPPPDNSVILDRSSQWPGQFAPIRDTSSVVSDPPGPLQKATIPSPLPLLHSRERTQHIT